MNLDPKSLIEAFGYLGLFLIVFAETGLLAGFFLPGDSLLFTAGFLASQDILNIAIVVPLLFGGALLGDSTGYLLGHRFGAKIFSRPQARILNPTHIAKSQRFYAAHGGKTVIFARFMPVVRAFAPVLAGVAKMPYGRFLSFSIIGNLMWSVGISLMGYYLGRSVPNIERYLAPTIVAVILISLSPAIWHLLKHRGERRRLWTWAKQRFSKD